MQCVLLNLNTFALCNTCAIFIACIVYAKFTSLLHNSTIKLYQKIVMCNQTNLGFHSDDESELCAFFFAITLPFPLFLSL